MRDPADLTHLLRSNLSRGDPDEGDSGLEKWKSGLWRVLVCLTRRKKCLQLNQIIFRLVTRYLVQL